jgi:hypothetical protein
MELENDHLQVLLNPNALPYDDLEDDNFVDFEHNFACVEILAATYAIRYGPYITSYKTTHFDYPEVEVGRESRSGLTYNGDGGVSGIETGTVGAFIPNHHHCNYKRPSVPDSELASVVEDFGLIIGDRIGEAYSEDAYFGSYYGGSYYGSYNEDTYFFKDIQLNNGGFSLIAADGYGRDGQSFEGALGSDFTCGDWLDIWDATEGGDCTQMVRTWAENYPWELLDPDKTENQMFYISKSNVEFKIDSLGSLEDPENFVENAATALKNSCPNLCTCNTEDVIESMIPLCAPL